MADWAIHLLTAQYELDRPTDQPRRHDAEDLRPRDQTLRAETAAEEGAANMDLFWRNPEQSSDAALRHRQPLARRVDRQDIAIPRNDDGVRLHGIVILGRRLVGRINALRRRRETCLDIAKPHFCRITDADGCRH